MAASATIDASNIIFFIYSSLFRSRSSFSIPDSAPAGRQHPSAPRPNNCYLFGILPFVACLPRFFEVVDRAPRASARGSSGCAQRTHVSPRKKKKRRSGEELPHRED